VGAGKPEPSKEGVVDVLPSKKSVGSGSPGVGVVGTASSDVEVADVLPSKKFGGPGTGVCIMILEVLPSKKSEAGGEAGVGIMAVVSSGVGVAEVLPSKKSVGSGRPLSSSEVDEVRPSQKLLPERTS